MRRLIILVAAATVASCGNPAPDNRMPANEAADGAANPAPVGNTAEPALPAPIPAIIQGRWGLVPADCTSTRGDAKGLLEISEKELRFYESRGTLRGIVESDASRIVGDFDFTGEGQNWNRRMSLDAQDEGRTLIRREQGADAMPGPLRYRRCESA